MWTMLPISVDGPGKELNKNRVPVYSPCHTLCESAYLGLRIRKPVAVYGMWHSVVELYYVGSIHLPHGIYAMTLMGSTQ
jgi:hypothetical protein